MIYFRFVTSLRLFFVPATSLNYVIFILQFPPELLTVELGKPWNEWFVTWSNAISHIGCWLLRLSMRIIKLQPRFKVGNISYLRVLFHSTMLLLTFWYINHKKIKGKECIHVTIFINAHLWPCGEKKNVCAFKTK